MIARLNILIEQNPSRREFYEAIENSLKETAWNVSEEAGGCNKTRCRAAYSWFNENLHYLTIYGMENLCDGYDPNHPWFTED